MGLNALGGRTDIYGQALSAQNCCGVSGPIRGREESRWGKEVPGEGAQELRGGQQPWLC